MPKPIQWTEKLPLCDFCSMHGLETPAPYDGKTTQGPWGNMCDLHLKEYGFPVSNELTFERVTTNADPSI